MNSLPVDILQQFYTAFQQRNYKKMQECYHENATFQDPVFGTLTSVEVKTMWEMLLTSARDLTIVFGDIKANECTASCRWEAWYTFSKTGRNVHNIIEASFELKDGKIFRHHDRFDLWRWARQALGFPGMLLGWSPLIQNKIRATAQKSLQRYMASRQ
jgi:ketosteroid isomerase-like protein